MGTEAAALGLVGAGTLLGANQTRKANKQAKREGRIAEANLERTRQETATAQQALSKKVEQQQRKLAIGQARANRSRLRGGVFGENEPTTRNLNPTLG